MDGDSDARPASRAITIAILLGAAGDLLHHGQPAGLNVTLWIGAVALAAGWSCRGTDRARGWALPIVLLSVGAAIFTLRDAPFLQLLGGGLVFAALSAALLLEPLRSGLAGWAAASATGAASVGILGVGTLAGARGSGRVGARRRALIALRASLAAAPILLVFGGLFVSADPLFEWYVRRALDLVPEALLEHTALTLAFAWIAAGILYGTRAISIRDPALPAGPLARWHPEILVVLVLVDLLFLAFLAIQAHSLFGGAALVESTTGLTYAQYAREGFFQLVAVAALAIPILLAVEWAMPPGARLRRPLVALAGTLVALVLVVLASAAHRMGLYQAAYGWTELRLYTTAFMGWMGLVCVWLGATVLRGKRERFVAGALLGGAGVAAALAAMNPGGWIVRVNAARAAETRIPFDAVYAASLGADATPALLEILPAATPVDRCRIAERLVRRWADSPEPDLRSWNLSRWRARRAVGTVDEDLRRLLNVCGAPAREDVSR